jgi:hypothetical protein
MAGIVYENGPINGTTDAWTINYGFIVGDTFTVSSGMANINGLSFGIWLIPGDNLISVQVTLATQPDSGTIFFNQMVNFTGSGCSSPNQYGYNVCTETATFNGPTLPNGTYWLTLQNASVSNGDPAYWDENSGVGCHSPGCPSQTYYYPEGTIPSESFSILGGPSGSTPESSNLILFGSGVVGLAAVLRRKIGI